MIKINKENFSFDENKAFGNKTIKREVYRLDSASYNLPITCIKLKQLYEKNGLNSLHRYIHNLKNVNLLLRIGLARGWSPRFTEDKRNYTN